MDFGWLVESITFNTIGSISISHFSTSHIMSGPNYAWSGWLDFTCLSIQRGKKNKLQGRARRKMESEVFITLTALVKAT